MKLQNLLLQVTFLNHTKITHMKISACKLFSIFSIALLSTNLFAQNAYITHVDINSISVINTKTNTVIATIPTPFVGPDAVVVSPDGSKAFITYFDENNHTNNFISVINTSTNTIINNISLGLGGIIGADGIDISPDGSKLYYAGVSIGSNYDTVYVVNTNTSNVIAKIVMPSKGTEGIAVSPDGKKVFVAVGNLITVINTVTNTISSTINTGTGTIYGVAVSPDGTKLYATDMVLHQIIVINTSTNAIVANIPTTTTPGTQPLGVAVSPDGTKVYASNYSSYQVVVINAINNTLTETISGIPQAYGIAFTLDGSKVYVAGGRNPDYIVAAINTDDNSIASTIPVGGYAVAFGKFIGGPAVDTIAGSYQVNTNNAPVIKDTFFNSLQKNSGELYADINPHNNNLGKTLWGANIHTGSDIQNTYGWFGNIDKEYGAFMNRNIFVTPNKQPTSINTVRIYCTNADIQNFLDSFNVQYGTTRTINDIRIIKYDGSNVDLDWNNNDDNSSKYTSIIPSKIGNYGFTNEFRFFEFEVNSYSEFWLALTSPNGVLAINLKDFLAEKMGNKVMLKWECSGDENLSHFDIERSKDGINFSKIITVNALAGNSSTQNYSVTDESPDFPKSFYRLKSIEKDGSFSYSKVVLVKFDNNEGFTIFPNPVKNTLNVVINQPVQNNTLKIFDANGKILRTILLPNNSSTIAIDVSKLAKGYYMLTDGSCSKFFIKM